MKKRLTAKKGKWVEALPAILWVNRTTPRVTTGQTPFSLVYGCEAVLPAKVSIPAARYGLMMEQLNCDEMINDLDSIEELRDATLIRMAAQQQIIASSFNKK